MTISRRWSPGSTVLHPRALIGAGLLVSVAWAGAARAQTATGSLRGYVSTTAGGAAAGTPLGDAQVVARYVTTNQTRGTLTNATGFYYLGGLRPGRYQVTVRRVGSAPETREVQVGVGQTVDLNVTLGEQAAQLTAVRVQATGTRETTRTSEVGGNVTREQIANLPNFERNLLDLARLVPGVTATNVNSTDKTVAINGQPAEAVNVFVDGATYKNDVLKGGVAGQDASKGNPFPQDAVQEFRVITQNYKAEYQKAGSGIITATTRSGGNEVEANAFAYGIGQTWVARDAFTAGRGGPRPTYRRLQAGGSLGAPIVRDKLFFFGTYELNFRDEPQNVVLGGDVGRAPAALLAQLNPLGGQFTSEFRQHLGFGKLTWQATDRSTVDVSVNARAEDDFRGFGGQTTFEGSEQVNINVYTGVANWRWAGARWLNEAQLNTQWFQWNPGPSNRDVVGRNYFGLLRTGGRDSWQDFRQTRISLRDDVTRGGVQLAGDHVFKFGASVDFLGYDAEKFQLGNPEFRYRSEENWSRPFEAGFGFGDPKISATNQQVGLYAQDDWSIGRKLVLNLGVRWDVETNGFNNTYVTPGPLADSLRTQLAAQFFVEQPTGGAPARRRVVDELGGIQNYISAGRSSRPVFWGAFQPRVGASYDVFGNTRTVLFGGLGLYYDRNYWNTLLDEQFRRQFRVLTVSFRDQCGTGAPANCAVWDPRYFDPAQLRTLSGSAGRPEVFLVSNDLRPPRTTQASVGLRQGIGGQVLTVTYNGVRGRNYMNFIRATPFNGLGPNYSTAFITDDRVRTWYDALQLQVERPVTTTSRWGGSLAYTLSRSEEQGQSQDIFWGFDDRYPTVGDRPRLRAPGDQRHAVVVNAVVRLPYDIRLSGIGSFGSGVTVNATDASGGFGFGQQRTYVFQPPTRSFLGVGNVFATQSVDLRAEKLVPVRSGQRVSLLVDVFNAFNQSNFGCFETTINPTNGPANARYGQPNCAGLGRRLQVGLRYGVQPRSQVAATSGTP